MRKTVLWQVTVQETARSKCRLPSGYRYREVLNEYYQAFSEKWHRGQMEESQWVYFGCSYVDEEVRLNQIGYCFMDMNHDGSNELLIGEIAPEGTGPELVSGNILSMFAFKRWESILCIG